MSSDSYKLLVEKFIEHDAVSSSNSIEDLEVDDAASLLDGLSPEIAARILTNLQINFSASIIEKLSDQSVSNTLFLQGCPVLQSH